jgi:glycosyltransferase involved in cell wall biosynthesis
MQINYQTLPKISIITPCLNGERYIGDAIESVLRQGYTNCEHIVVDGASTDGTVTKLQQYPYLAVISEPDRGSHDAMNKGIARATGEIIGFLNVDDFYPDNTLQNICTAFAANPTADIVVGDTVVFEDAAPGRRTIRFVFAHPRGNWLAENMFGNPGINGYFFRRSVFDKIGLIDNAYQICADRDFLIRAAVAGVESVSLHTPTIWYRAHSAAKTMNRNRSNIVAITIETFHLASHFLESSIRVRSHERIARAWHAFEGARLIYIQVRYGRLFKAAKYFVRYNLRNPLWPFHLVHGIILRRITRQNYRGGWNADLSDQVSDKGPLLGPLHQRE